MDSIKQYFQFVTPYWKLIVATIFIGILKFGLPMLLPLVLMYIVDVLIDPNSGLTQEERIRQLVWIMAACFFVFTVIRFPVEYYRHYLAQWVGNKVLYDIRNSMFAHLQKLSLRFYHRNKSGELISRVIHDVEQTKTFVMTGLMNLWLDFVTLFIAIGIMFYLDVKLTLVTIAIFPLFGLAVKYFFQRLRKYTRDRSQALAEMQGHLHERVQGISVVRSFALEDHEQKQFGKRNNNFLDKALIHTRWNAKTHAVINTLTDIAPLLVLSYGGYYAIQGDISVGALVAFYAYLERIYAPLRRFVNASTVLTQAVASMDRVFELYNEAYDIKDKPSAREAKSIRGEVSFENVSFRYAEENELVLRDINLRVAPGETIAFVGMSGGGKSSLISLIPRFFDVTAGTIRIDGVDIRDFQVRSLRDKIGMVLQDSILFSDSVRENILMGNPKATEQEMLEAAEAASAHEFISVLPQGYDTPIGERGVKLSGGQKQRIALARLFLKNPPILILDEATSALDLESEQIIQHSIAKLAQDRTTFVVAHRLSTITHADRIVVIEDGRIVETGNHQQLMADEGVYYNLYHIQELN